MTARHLLPYLQWLVDQLKDLMPPAEWVKRATAPMTGTELEALRRHCLEWARTLVLLGGTDMCTALCAPLPRPPAPARFSHAFYVLERVAALCAVSHEALGEREQARAFYERAAAAFAAALGPEHASTVQARERVVEMDASLATPAVVQRQLEGRAAVSVRGVRCDDGDFDGVYRPAGEHEGWPRFESAAGHHLYRFAPEGVWCLSDEFDPAKAGLDARCVTADGALPEGAAMWKCWVDGEFAPVEVALSLQD